jgi:stalled ribosome alternative rescue factor ArfA
MSNKVVLKEVSEQVRRSKAKRLRSHLFEDCRMLVDELDGDVSGYALVAWTTEGELRSIYHTGRGLIRPAIIPALVHDALNRQVAQDIAAPSHIIDSDA